METTAPGQPPQPAPSAESPAPTGSPAPAGPSPASVPVPPLRGDFANLGAALDAAAGQFGDRDAYVEPDARLSFAQWAARADALAGFLAERGVGAGDVVALMLPSSIDYAVCYAATVRLGAIITGLNTRLGPREVEAILARATPAVVIRDDTLGLPPVPAGFEVLARADLPAAYTHPGLGGDVPAVTRTDPAVIIWTSGTTGLPKGAWFDHDNLAAAVASAGVMSRPYDRRLVATPFPHAGYMAKVWDQVAWGSAIVISPVPWTAAAMAALLRDERITVGGGVPTQWAKLLDTAEATDAGPSPFPALRLGVVATAPAPPELVERTAARLGVPLVVRYAMTESPSITGTEPDDPPEIQFRTVGRPQTGLEVRVADGEGNPVPVGEIGRVWVRGTCVMRGYWREPELTAGTLRPDGWLVSGDLGYRTPEGHLVISGRASDLYIRGGYNVYPLEVENVLVEHPAVSRAAVVGLPTAVIGEIGVAFVVPSRPDDPPTLADLRAWTRERLADYKAPDHLEIVDELPLTTMLKVDKDALRRLAAAAPPPARR